MSRLGRLASRLALRLYPGAWRERFGPEVADLIGESDSSMGDALDLAGAAVREHAIGGAPMRFEPAHRHPGAFAVGAGVLLLPTLAAVGLSIIGHELGVRAVAAAVDPVLAWVNGLRVVDLALVAAPLASFLLAALPILDLRLERFEDAPVVSLRVRAVTANIVVAALALLVGGMLVAHIVIESVLEAGA